MRDVGFQVVFRDLGREVMQDAGFQVVVCELRREVMQGVGLQVVLRDLGREVMQDKWSYSLLINRTIIWVIKNGVRFSTLHPTPF